jgi:acyl-CoA reductase-like NAD-dependent aldehyde dehydrogenase
VDRDREQFAWLIVAEAGKTIREARGEVDRAVQALTWCAEEAKRIGGEVIPLSGTRGSENRLGMTLPVPLGPVCAITPFNAPLNQLNHKVPTAIAAGCPVVLKPSELAPLSGIRLVRLLVESGLRPGHIGLVFGDGKSVGNLLLDDQRFKAYSFTGSVAVGLEIQRRAGLRRTVLELGSSTATIVHEDAELPVAAEAVARSAFAYAGQLCIATQRVLVHDAVYEDFLSELCSRVASLRVGDPGDETTDVGPLISLRAADRVRDVIARSVERGARVATGGDGEGSFVTPTVLTDVAPSWPVVCEEVFGPVVSVLRYRNLEELFELANGTPYGLQAALFTESLDAAITIARQVEVGSIVVNEASHFRADHMPFGGVRQSGTGREGIRYAIEAFTSQRLVVIKLDH